MVPHPVQPSSLAGEESSRQLEVVLQRLVAGLGSRIKESEASASVLSILKSLLALRLVVKRPRSQAKAGRVQIARVL